MDWCVEVFMICVVGEVFLDRRLEIFMEGFLGEKE